MLDMQDIFGQVLSPKALDLINSYCQKFSAFPNTINTQVIFNMCPVQAASFRTAQNKNRCLFTHSIYGCLKPGRACTNDNYII